MKILRFVLRSVGGLWSALMILLMVMSLSLSVAMTLVPAVFSAVSGVVGAAKSLVGNKTLTVTQLYDAERKQLTAQRDKLTAETQKLTSERDKLTVEKDRLNTEKNKLNAEKDRLKRQLASPEVDYRGAKKPVREAVSDTSTRIANRITAAASRNVTSTFGEAIPGIGVGVIVAATAWEIADACQLLNDVRELDAAFNPDNPIDPTEVCGIKPPTSDEIWTKLKSAPQDVWQKMTQTYEGLPDQERVLDVLNGLTAQAGGAWNLVSGAVIDGAAYVVQIGREGIGDGMESARGLVEPFFGDTDVQSDQSP